MEIVEVDIDELKFLEGQKVNIDELNFLAKYLDSLINEEIDTFLAIVQTKNIKTMKDAINAAFNQTNYTLIQNVSNMEQIGKTHFMSMNMGMTEEEKVKTDFAKIGKELTNSGRGVITNRGILFEHENAIYQEVYNGKTFPLYLYEPCIYIANIEYNGENRSIMNFADF